MLQSVVILAGLSVFFFFLLHESPGGPCDAFSAAGQSGAVLARYHACVVRLHLDAPLPGQYLAWVGNLLHGDLGVSNQNGTPVWEAISARLPATFLLAAIAYLITEVIAIPLGIFAALRRYSFFDSFFTVFSYIGLSLPSFFLASVMIVLFAVTLNWFPAGGIVGDTANIPTFNGPGYWDYFFQHPWHAGTDFLQHLFLPAMVYVILGLAVDSRFMRASMLEVINQDYIRTARAKGLPRRVVIWKHAVRNALLPIVTNVALAIPALFAGTVIVESIFGWPGLGLLFYNSLQGKDYPIILALLMFGAILVLIGNLLGDLAYAWVDPRIRYD
jgi:peptide/nickel transport system permease protein